MSIMSAYNFAKPEKGPSLTFEDSACIYIELGLNDQDGRGVCNYSYSLSATAFWVWSDESKHAFYGMFECMRGD